MPKRLDAALNYNENKVKQGKARCIAAVGYLRSASQMNFYQKLEGFERLNVLNDRATTKTIHVSLNFDPCENLSCDQLVGIAADYMQRIGFGAQPYLVYKHLDAGHPHIHLISTTIREDGSRIATHNIGKNQSQKARSAIEESFGLIKAENHKRSFLQKVQPVTIEKLMYGKAETKKSIEAIINSVIHTYKFSSLPEFNAILKQFNVLADRGQEQGRIYRHRGLVYRILHADGSKVGVPIKASDINGRPTLDKLEKLFTLHHLTKDGCRSALKIKIDHALQKRPNSLKELIEALRVKNIYTVLRSNNEGRIYGITFVDNDNRTVFNGSDLGKPYSAGNLQALLLQSEKQSFKNKVPVVTHDCKQEPCQQKNAMKSAQDHQRKSMELAGALLSPEKQIEGVAFALWKKKKKRKRRPPGL